MSKKRVYELAKELGIGNKEIIARLEKLGIAVKSSTSSLEDGEVERVKRELHSSAPQEMVEQRIKTTVIRRRVVRSAVEEIVPVAEVAPEEVPAVQAAAVQAAAVPPALPEEKPQPEEVSEEVSKEEEPVLPAQVSAPFLAPEPEPQKAEEPEAKKEAIVVAPSDQPVPRTKEAVAVPKGPEPEPVPKRREETRPLPKQGQTSLKGQKRPEPETTVTPKRFDSRPPVRKEGAPAAASQRTHIPAPGAKRDIRPGQPPVPTGVFVPTETPRREDIDRLKKKGKRFLEVVVTEQESLRKKPFIKKVIDKNLDKKVKLIEDTDFIDRPVKWRDEKKIQPVKMQKTVITIPKAIKRRIRVSEAITVSDLARKMGVKASEVINKLLGMGLMVSINQYVDCDTATLISADFGYQVEHVVEDFEEIMQKTAPQAGNLMPRAPVVTIMGHVDHGKTSLLDAIRQTNVIDGEAGGITQAIGAYHVQIKGRDIVFLDTPGHEAFTAMRARGAQVTDIVVLVVAADDGVKEQTIEAINHAREADVPIIVAVNKIDKPGGDPDKIKQTLTEYHLVSEEWGGDTIFCEVSAKKKIGLEGLLEMILLQADVMELKADPTQPARGVVIESKLDRGRGPVATVLIQEGTLKEGDAFISKTEFGRVRAMLNDQGKRVKEAGPAMPVEVIGFSGVPHVGSEFVSVEDEKKARGIGEYLVRKERGKELSRSSKITLEQLYQKIKEGVKDFHVIIKGDVEGSVEALSEALSKLSNPEVRLRIIHCATGTITETDVMLASASDAIIIGFNVRPDGRVAELAEQEGVEIKLYDIIYNVIADVKAAMEGVLDPVYKEVVQGRAEVRDTFKVTRIGTVAGCYLTEGKISRNLNVKLIRDGVVVYDGKIHSLKRFKDDVKEVAMGFECGIAIEGFNDIKNGDIIEAYQQQKVERK